MKVKLFFIHFLLLLTLLSFGQSHCKDSSYRLKYTFGNQGAVLYNTPDIIGKNIFTGTFTEGTNNGIALLKTTWGDSLIWAKKVYLGGGALNSFAGPSSSVICTGVWGPASSQELLIGKFDSTGVVQWIKRYRFNPLHLRYNAGNYFTKNISVTNNAIYFNARFNSYYNVIAKLDLNGNIIWSRSFSRNSFPNTNVIDATFFQNNSIYFAASLYDQPSPGLPAKLYHVVTELNDTDGSIIKSNSFKTVFDTLGVFPFFFKANNDNTFSVSGFLGTSDGSGVFGLTDMAFNSRIDMNFDEIYNYYYNNQILLDAQESYFDFNNQSQNTILSADVLNPLDKYFVTFDQNGNIYRSRRFTTPTINSGIYRTSVNLDDKLNLHFINHYPQTGKIITEYARISDFAPSSIPGCFGKDTSILTQYPFTLIKSPFTWENVTNDVLINNPVSFIEDTAIVTKELVCKLVSYCDSIHISGPDSVCINQPVRYSIGKNAECLKSLQWNIDTTLATIVNSEADTAVTISFKRAFSGYIHAAVYNCVVSDSFFVTVFAPQPIQLLNKDSLLCPGKTIVLKAAAGFTTYRWQDGSTADSLPVTSPGFYKVTGTDNCGFQTADSITVNYSDSSLLIPGTQTICRYDTAFITLPPDVNNITWQPAGNGLLINNSLSLFPAQTTTYQVTAERVVNCPITKTSTVVIKNCNQTVFLPNAFTPNNDGRNDVFKASVFSPLLSYHLAVYNRYGQKVFETGNIAEGWDGTFKGKPQPIGGYTYRCSYRFAGKLQNIESGYFMLIR